MAVPDPSQVAPWYLRNITQALELDEATGNVFIRTNASIIGNVSVGNVAIGSLGNVDLTGNTLPVTVESGNVTVYQGTDPWIVTGNVNANVSGNVGILGNVNVTQGTTPWSVTGNVQANVTGGNITVQPSAISADFFGEPYAIPITPVVQTDGRYGTNNYDHQIYTNAGGNVNHGGGAFSISSSSTVGSYALLRSRRFNTFKPGQTFMARWFAKFDALAAGTSQRLGVQNQENAYYFGSNGGTFGVLHTYNGLAPIYQVTVTSYTGTQTVTLVLNGVTYTTTIQSGETINQAAQRISEINFGGAWLANQRDNTVELLATSVGAMGGTFSVSGSGTSSLSIAQLQAGAAATNAWVYDGTDFDMPAWFDPELYNQYEVKYGWAGINFFVLNPTTGDFELFYQFIWAGTAAATQLPVTNPAFKIAALVLNTGAGSGVTMNVASMMMGLEGITNRNSYTGATAVTKTSLTQNTLHHLVSIQNPYTFSSTINTIETLMSDFVATTQCNDPTEVYMYLDAPLATGIQDFVSQDGYPVTVSTATGTVDPATNFPIVSFVVGNTGSSVQFALESYRLVIPPGSTITIAIRSTATIQKAAASIVWYND